MPRLDPVKLIQEFRRHEGAVFVCFVDKLVRAICREQGVPASAMPTHVEPDVLDGGVYARSGQASPADTTGYFLSSYVWQCKAVDEANVTVADIQKEVNKPYVRSRVKKGASYRLCICDLLTDEKKTELTNALRKAIGAIKPDATEPGVLDVRDLAALANNYPQVVPLLVRWEFGHWVGESPPGETASADAYCGNCEGPLGCKDYFGWYTCPRCKHACCGRCGGSLEPNGYGYGPGPHLWYQCPHCGDMDASGILTAG
jgi:hypothetical protein